MKLAYLKLEQQPQRKDDGDGTKNSFPFSVFRFTSHSVGEPFGVQFHHRPHHIVVDNALADQKEDKVGCAVGVKHDGKQKQGIVPELPWCEEIGHQEDGQEEEEEDVAAEYHVCCIRIILR